MAVRPASPTPRSASSARSASNAGDPDLLDLPRGPRTARFLTLAVLACTALVSLALAWALLPDARYALSSGAPDDIGSLAELELELDDGAAGGGRWVRGSGAITNQAVGYRRPLDTDSYRLARLSGSERLWVQMRIPEGMPPEHFVPPASFVGRLLPLDSAGLRHESLGEALGQLDPHPEAAWLLIDGEAPATTRWALALLALFAGFAGFSVYGFLRLTRPVRE